MGFTRKKDFSKLTPEECREMALNRVYRSLSASEQSTLKMRRKMESEGYPPDSIDYAIERACRIGAMDDRRYCECLLRTTAMSGKGLEFALKEVEELGIEPHTLESYNEYMQEGDDAHVEQAVDYLRRHPSRAKDVRGAAYRKLMGKGYPSGIASTASRIFAEECR